MSRLCYIVPTADVSCQHSCSTGSSGWALIDDETADDASTYIYHTISTSSSTKTSTFTLTGTLPTVKNGSITSAQLLIRAYRGGSLGSVTASGTYSYNNGAKSGSISLSSGAWTTTTVTLDTSDFSLGSSYSIPLQLKTTGNTSKNTVDIRITQAIVKITVDATYNITKTVIGDPGTITLPETATLDSSVTLNMVQTTGPVLKVLLNDTDITSQLIHTEATEESSATDTYTISAAVDDYAFVIYYELPYYKRNGTWNVGKKVYKKIDGAWVEQLKYSTIWDSNLYYQYKFL